MLDAFDLRTNGLRGMAEVFASAGPSNRQRRGAELPCRCSASSLATSSGKTCSGSRPGASWTTSTSPASRSRLGLPAEPRHRDHRVDESVWQRIHGAATGGANCEPRGTGIVSTRSCREQGALDRDDEHGQLSTDLTFAVTIENSGCAQEVGLKVRLTIQQSPRPSRSAHDRPHRSGDEATVDFPELQDARPTSTRGRP